MRKLLLGSIAILLLLDLFLVGLVFYKPQKNMEVDNSNNIDEIIKPKQNTIIENELIPLSTITEEIQPPIPAEPIIYNTTISATGDLMVHTWQLNDAFNSTTNDYDFNHNFQYINKYLSSSDLTIGNLETVLGGIDAVYSDFPMFNTPDTFAMALKNTGFDILTTANNHSNDRRKNGVLRTLDILDNYQLEHFGTYATQEAQDTIFIKEVNNMKLAFLSYTYGTNGLETPVGEDYLINRMTEELIKQDIARAKALKPDLIIVMPHMGNEYELKPRAVFKNWAYFMVQHGADIVLASHPHVLQPAEFVDVLEPDGTKRTAFIAFSLGNFISSQRTTPRDAGVIINLSLEKVGDEKAYIKEVSYIPTWVKFVNANGNYNISVLSVYDTLTSHFAGEDVDLRQRDIERLKAVHSEATINFQNKYIPFEQMQEKYILEKLPENTAQIIFEQRNMP